MGYIIFKLKILVYLVCLFKFIQGVSLTETYTDFIREVTILSGADTDCSQTFDCQNSSSCADEGLCGRKCLGRTNYPTMHVFSSSAVPLKTCLNIPATSTAPPNATNDSTRILQFLENKICSQNLEFIGDTTVSFWIKGSCKNCLFLSINGTDNNIYKFSLQGAKLFLNNEFITQTTKWVHVVLRVMSTCATLFIDNIIRTLNTINSGTINKSTVTLQIGLDNLDIITLADVRIYEDFLTDREIQYINNGESIQNKDCRCPASSPTISEDANHCSSDGSQTSRYNDTEYYSINDAVLDGNTSTKWKSNGSGNISILVKLYDTYQVDEITVSLEQSKPIDVQIETLSSGEWLNDMFDVVINNTLITGTAKSQTPEKLSVSSIKLTLIGRQSSSPDIQIIIPEIYISGKCACNGNADSCSRPVNYQSYTCNCNIATNSGGQKCEACQPNYYQKPNKLVCSPCMCNVTFVENVNNTCSEDGKCICKKGRTGDKCDQCDDFYYKNPEDTLGCKECVCHMFGSNSSICNKDTGQCPCLDGDMSDLQCIPTVDKIEPQYGPKSGGTTVTITGKNLSPQPLVYVNGKNQTIKYSTTTKIVYKTEAAGGVGETEIRWRSHNLTLPSFTFKPDPQITDPQNTPVTIIKSCSLRFSGINLNSVYRPKIRFKSASNNTTTQECQIISSSTIVCIVPNLTDEETYTSTLDLECPNCRANNDVTIVSDPKIAILDEAFTSPFTKTISIIGSQFDVCDKEDVLVYIGSSQCKIDSLSATEIIFSPPSDPPVDGIKIYSIKVQIGKLNISAGKIIYKDFVDSAFFIYIMVGIGVLILLVLIVLGIVCFWRRRKAKQDINDCTDLCVGPKNPRFNSYSDMPQNDIHPMANLSFDNGAFASPKDNTEEFAVIKKAFLQKLQHGLRSDIDKCLMNDNEFTIGRTCMAKGDKARMVDGILTKDNSKLTVKSLRQPLQDDSYPEWVFAALAECLRLRSLGNNNILRLIGIGIEKHKFHILYPYMKNRTLKDNISDIKKEFSLKHLLEYGAQVAEGMSYLEDNNVVHRDLAARNCMVDDTDTVKITDAAFSFDFYPTEYTKDPVKNRFLPVRWMAPDCLAYGFYDTKSDVWSFGVLLWELLTRGCLPYVDTHDDAILDLINHGYRLGKPEIISDPIYDMVNTCWEENSELRPSFLNMANNIAKFMNEDSSEQDDLYINWTKPRQSIYMNSESMKRKYDAVSDQSVYLNVNSV